VITPPSSVRQSATVAVLLLVMLSGVASSVLAQATPSAGRATDDTAVSASAASRDFTGALVDSFKLVMLEHLTRIVSQEKTRAELTGPFWKDYRQSIVLPRQWEDTDSWMVNYVGHPIHGAAAGIVWLDHSDKDRAASIFSRGTSRRARGPRRSAPSTACSSRWSTERGVSRQRRAQAGNRGLGGLCGDASRCVCLHDRGRCTGPVLRALGRGPRQEPRRPRHAAARLWSLPIPGQLRREPAALVQARSAARRTLELISQMRRHSAGDASPLAALLLPHIWPDMLGRRLATGAPRRPRCCAAFVR